MFSEQIGVPRWQTVSMSKYFSPCIAQRFWKAIVREREERRGDLLLKWLIPLRIEKYCLYLHSMSLCVQSGGESNHFEISFLGTPVGRSRGLWKLPPCVPGCFELRCVAEGLSGLPVTKIALVFASWWCYLHCVCHREGIVDEIVFINHKVLCKCRCCIFSGNSGLKWERW